MFLGVLFWYFSLARGVSRCPPPTHTMFFPEGFQVREFFWAPRSVSQKLPWGLILHGCSATALIGTVIPERSWNSLPVSIRSACTERDVSTINLYLDSYIDFLQITFLITTCNSIVFVCDSIHSHCKYALSFVFIVILKVDWVWLQEPQ